ncbi:MAG: prepilin-type N-terminal cleavage/methylation domain-containing protein [Planctomycetota bacterium]
MRTYRPRVMPQSNNTGALKPGLTLVEVLLVLVVLASMATLAIVTLRNDREHALPAFILLERQCRAQVRKAASGGSIEAVGSAIRLHGIQLEEQPDFISLKEPLHLEASDGKPIKLVIYDDYGRSNDAVLVLGGQTYLLYGLSGVWRRSDVQKKIAGNG